MSKERLFGFAQSRRGVFKIFAPEELDVYSLHHPENPAPLDTVLKIKTWS